MGGATHRARRGPLRTGALSALALVIGGAVAAQEAGVLGRSRVGVALRLDGVVLPPPEVRARPLAPGAALVLRVLRTAPHGRSFRYDLEVQGLEAGRHDLRSALETLDGAPLEAVEGAPPLEVEIEDPLAPGPAEPHRDPPAAAPALGGYRVVLASLTCLWLLAGLWLGLGGRRRVATPGGGSEVDPEALRAHALAALVERATAGTLDAPGKADLERALLGHWRRRKGITDESAEAALAILRADPDTRPLFDALSAWLYEPQATTPRALAALLAPYRRGALAPTSAPVEP